MHDTAPRHPDSDRIDRREAIRRTALALGVVLSPGLLRGALERPASAAAAAGSPAHLSAAQYALVAALAERILPRTDTPGALDVGVPAFVDRMVGDYLTPVEKEAILGGLGRFEATCESETGGRFAGLAPSRQDAFLKSAFDRAAGLDYRFMLLLRELVIIGYFTSEEVGTTVLHYSPVPGRFNGCVPVGEVGNVNWTT